MTFEVAISGNSCVYVSTMSPLGFCWYWSVYDFWPVSWCDHQWESQGKVEQKTTSKHDAIRREVCQTPVERQHKRTQKPDGDSGMTKPERRVSLDSVHRTTWIRVGCQICFLHNIPRETGKPLASRVHGHKIPACVSGKHRWRLFTGLHFESNRPPTHPGPNKARKRVFRKLSPSYHIVGLQIRLFISSLRAEDDYSDKLEWISQQKGSVQ